MGKRRKIQYSSTIPMDFIEIENERSGVAQW
jgi:hypothetical protein